MSNIPTIIGEPADTTNIPKNIKFHSILAANQVCLNEIIEQSKQAQEMKIIIRRKEEGGLSDNIRKFDEANYNVYDNIPSFFNKNIFLTTDVTEVVKDNYFLYFLDSSDFSNIKNLFQLYKSKNDFENLKDVCNKFDNAMSDFFNIMSTTFLQLLGDERYKQFELDGNFDDQIMVVETDIIFKFENNFEDNTLDNYDVHSIKILKDLPIPVKLVLCGYDKKKTEDIYLKLYDMIYKYDKLYHKQNKINVRIMPNNAIDIAEILKQYLEFQYYTDIKLNIHHTKVESKFFKDIIKIFNLNDRTVDKNNIEKVSNIIQKIIEKFSQSDFKNPNMLNCFVKPDNNLVTNTNVAVITNTPPPVSPDIGSSEPIDVYDKKQEKLLQQLLISNM